MYYQVNSQDVCLEKGLARAFGETYTVHLKIACLRHERQEFHPLTSAPGFIGPSFQAEHMRVLGEVLQMSLTRVQNSHRKLEASKVELRQVCNQRILTDRV